MKLVCKHDEKTIQAFRDLVDIAAYFTKLCNNETEIGHYSHVIWIEDNTFNAADRMQEACQFADYKNYIDCDSTQAELHMFKFDDNLWFGWYVERGRSVLPIIKAAIGCMTGEAFDYRFSHLT
jgi:hypothetical protein